MSNNSKEPVAIFDLLHPELLTAQQLADLLKERNIPIDDLSEENLLELFRRTILPLPQRDCRANRRGQLLSRTRSKVSLKRKSLDASEITSKPTIKLEKIDTSPADGQSRLKSPPAVSPSNKKIITFNSQTVNGSEKAKNLPNECSKSAIKIINETLKSNDGYKSNGSDVSLQVKRNNEAADDSPKKKHKPITWP